VAAAIALSPLRGNVDRQVEQSGSDLPLVGQVFGSVANLDFSVHLGPLLLFVANGWIR
jgi:hypothetical protein